MATPGKATKKEKKKPVPVKTSLNNPYDLKWTPLEKGLARFILNAVKEKMDALALRKRRAKVLRERRSERKGGKGTADSVDAREPTQRADSAPRGWTDKGLRNELAIGINEVTKGLERHELGLVLVCDSVRPAHMTSHLIPLSRTRSVPACQVPGLSASLAASLGLASVLALGFKRESATFADTIAALALKVPPLGVAWAPRGPGEYKAEAARARAGDAEAAREDAGAGKGRKRKVEASPEAEANENPVIVLQPLKVKKIIPNPSKVRKAKRKKVKQKGLH